MTSNSCCRVGVRLAVRIQSSGKMAVKRAFTLIELLVVIAIIALLVSLLLPALSSARDTTRDVICKSNMRQIGTAVQMYMDDQKDPNWFNLKLRLPNVYDHWIVPRALNDGDYIPGTNSKIYHCPRATAGTSVIDPTVRDYLSSGGRIFIDPDPSNPDAASLRQPVAEVVANPKSYTEYWFNDSNVITGKKYRAVKHPDWMVWICDAYDEVPKHSGKTRTELANQGNITQRVNQIYMLFGDQSIRAYSWVNSVSSVARDPYGSAPTFYNWGLFYN